jgi:hypothetical protein
VTTYDPSALQQVNNGCQQASGAVQNAFALASAKGLWVRGIVAEHKYKRMVSMYYDCGCGHGGHRATTRTDKRIARFNHDGHAAPSSQHPKTHVFSHLPAAGRHTRRSTPNSPPAATPVARASWTPLADQANVTEGVYRRHVRPSAGSSDR